MQMMTLILRFKLMEVKYCTLLIIISWEDGWGFFLVKFVIAIPSLPMVLKPMFAPPSFSIEKVGLILWAIPLGFVDDIVIFKVCFFLCKFQLWNLIPSSCVFVFLSFYEIPSSCFIILYLSMQYLHHVGHNLHP
jgi:hypothetical protein